MRGGVWPAFIVSCCCAVSLVLQGVSGQCCFFELVSAVFFGVHYRVTSCTPPSMLSEAQDESSLIRHSLPAPLAPAAFDFLVVCPARDGKLVIHLPAGLRRLHRLLVCSHQFNRVFLQSCNLGLVARLEGWTHVITQHTRAHNTKAHVS
jgi:hypothetical protein